MMLAEPGQTLSRNYGADTKQNDLQESSLLAKLRGLTECNFFFCNTHIFTIPLFFLQTAQTTLKKTRMRMNRLKIQLTLVLPRRKSLNQYLSSILMWEVSWKTHTMNLIMMETRDREMRESFIWLKPMILST